MVCQQLTMPFGISKRNKPIKEARARPVFDVAYASNLIFSRTSDALLHKMRAAGSPLLELSDPLTHASSFSSTKGSCVSEGGGVLS